MGGRLRAGKPSGYVTRSTWPFIPPGSVNEDQLQLRCKDMIHTIRGLTVRSLDNACVPQRFWSDVVSKKHYVECPHLYRKTGELSKKVDCWYSSDIFCVQHSTYALVHGSVTPPVGLKLGVEGFAIQVGVARAPCQHRTLVTQQKNLKLRLLSDDWRVLVLAKSPPPQ